MISSNSRKQGRQYSGFTGSLSAVTVKPFHRAVADPHVEPVPAPVQAVAEQPKGPDAPKP